MKMRGRHKTEPAPAVAASDADDERLAGVLVAAGLVEPYQLDAARGRPEHRNPGREADRRRRGPGRGARAHPRRPLRRARCSTSGTSSRTRRRWPCSPRSRRGRFARCPSPSTATRSTVAVLDPSPARIEAVDGRRRPPRRPGRRHAPRPRPRPRLGVPATRDVGSQVQAYEARDQLRREAAQLDAAGANEDAPVVRVVQMVITQGLRDRASDIHIEPSGDRIRVRYRIDGALTDVLDLPGSIGPAIVSRVKILGGMNIVERRRPQDGQISMDVEGREVDIRVATTAVVGGEKVVMRLLDKSRPLFKLEQLGMAADIAERYSALIRSPYGMVICAGPTGGGKTTTLYASLGELNSPERNIMTIEDPVEYTFDSINQIQINEQAGITFAGGLKSILRQDPDIILVGEIRDVDTARIAVQSAMTGHFVLSSLHATEAVSALYRLLDMGIESFLIASSITAVVAQRLVRRSCTLLPRALPAHARGARLPAQLRSRLESESWLRARRRLPHLRAHRLPRADRRLRAARGDRRGAGAHRRPGSAGRDAQGGPAPGHAHPAGAGRPAGPGRHHDRRRGHALHLRGRSLRCRSSPTSR